MTITNATLTGPNPEQFQFNISNGTIPGASYLNIPVYYLASARGTHTANLHITYSYEGVSYQYDLPLQGITRLRPNVSGSGIGFGIRYLNQSANAEAQFINNGSLDLTISSITLTGANPTMFQISGNTGTLPAGLTRPINVIYPANTVGIHSASINVAFEYDGLQYSIQLSLSGETRPIPIAQLWLDDVLIDEEIGPISWADGILSPTMTLTIDHPYAAPCDPGGTPGCYADQTSVYTLKRGASYVIISDFGGSKDASLLKKRQRILNNYRTIDGLENSSREVLTETLNLVGQTWMHQTTLSDNLLSQLSNVIHIRHHRFGIMAQEEGYYIDVKTQMSSIVSRNNTLADEDTCFRSISFLASAMEHGVLEQLQGINRQAASTIKLLDIANSNGDKIFLLDKYNFPSISSQLSGYDLTDMENKVNTGRVFVLPADGQLTLGQWQGKGYMELFEDSLTGMKSMGMIIQGDYVHNGGYAGDEWQMDVDSVYNEYFPDLYLPAEISNPESAEPVDMATGAYIYEHVDLGLGGAEPKGLHFSRFFNSDNNTEKRMLGYGWNHNYDIYLNIHSDVKSGLAMRQPVDAAALLVSSVITLDLMNSAEPAIKEWMTAVLTNKWAMDQLFENSVSVHLQNKVLSYIKLPDGSFNQPPGETTQLVKEGTLYYLIERFGARIDFNSDNRITQLKDVDGNMMTFTYEGENLKTVKDVFNRTLTLNYNGDNLASVSDSAGRSVSYGYDTGGNLTTYTDPESKPWSYGYDDPGHPHRMTSLTNPLTITTATNAYNSLGRVKTQTVPRQGGINVEYNYYFTGFKNMEEDPEGNRIVYEFDEKGRQVAQENALGHRSMNEYDGQNHVITYKDPKSNITRFKYDGNQNLERTTNALLQSTDLIYDSQFRLTDTIDPLYHGTHVEYDDEHHPLLSKSGIQYDTGFQPQDEGLVQTSATYFTNGLPQTATDGRGTVTTLTYNPYGSPQTTKVGTHPVMNTNYNSIGLLISLVDQVNSTTSFPVYNNRGQLKKKTDPLLKDTIMEYDDAGRLSYIIDRNSQRIDYTYTPTSKLDTITYPDASTVHFTYNQHDDLTGMQDVLGATIYAYDPVDVHRLTSITNPYDLVIGYSKYDDNGNLTELTYPGNKKVIYTYTNLNQLETVKIDWLNQTATYNYDHAGRLISLTNFNGTVTTYVYDNANRLTALENKKSDNITVISSYQFPDLDGNGNRKQIVQNEPFAPMPSDEDVTYIYNDKKNRMVTAGANNFAYNDEGQLDTSYGSSYSFDYEHRLVTAGTNQYSYDGSGNRLQAVRNGSTTRYIYDAGGNLLAEADGSNNITKYFIHGLGLLAMVTPADQTYCYHFNAVGSTIAMTDSGQNVVNKYAYDPFGKVTSQDEAVQAQQPFKFVGQHGVMTEPNGFYYMRARYYDPNVGRFISEDPIGFDSGDVNLYAYSANNPILLIDPDGLTVYRGFRAINASGYNLGGYGIVHHEFIYIENDSLPGGRAYYGLTSNSPIGRGRIAVNDQWDVNNSEHRGNMFEVTDINENLLIQNINQDIANPPIYSLIGNNCQDWVDKQLGQSRRTSVGSGKP